VLVTTGVAAAPMREKLLPLVANPFGLWSVAPSPVATVAPISASAPRFGAELEAPLTTAPDRMEYGGPTASSAATIARETTYVRWTNYLGSRRGGTASTSGGGRQAGGSRWASGGRDGITVAGGGGQQRRAEAARTSSSGNKPGSSGGSASGSSSSKSNKKPSGTSPAGAPQFTEHRLGLPELSHGLGLGPLQGGLGAARNAAATPEPATFLLLGTGLVAAAGAMRRRLR
jgi:hypothetical protein